MSKFASNKLSYIYALSAVLLWSSVASAFKLSLEYLKVIELLLYSSIVSSITLYLILIYLKKSNLILNFIKNNFYKILFFAILNPFLYYLLLFKAYSLLLAQEAQAINYTWALMLAFLSVPILKHKLNKIDILASFIAYGGVLLIISKASFSLSFTSLEGVFYALLSTIIWALYWLYSSKNKEEPIILMFSSFLFSIPIIFIYAILFESLSIPNIYGLMGATYVGLFEMGITFVLWLNALQYSKKVSNITNLIFLSPFLSLIFIYYILGEQIYISTIYGLILIVFALILQNRYKN